MASSTCGFIHMADSLASWCDGWSPRSIPRASIMRGRKQKLPGQLRYRPETGIASISTIILLVKVTTGLAQSSRGKRSGILGSMVSTVIKVTVYHRIVLVASDNSK